tara:strand:- start:20689 stop:21840 length:1152 start_codon:yes stop_codon:yes gene_type:complete
MGKPPLQITAFSKPAAGRRHHLTYAILLLACVALPVQIALAVDVPTLFTAQVVIDKEAKNPRDDAYQRALAEVLARVSGSSLSNNSAAIEEMFPVPAAYVTQFRPGEEDTLWVSFDDEAIERVLRASGQTVWGRERPLTLVWLAVDWGQGQREIIAAGEPEQPVQQGRSIDRNRLLRERVLEIARKRGLPLAFPLLDTADLQKVSFSDIWGGFDERVAAASERYDANSILIGRIRPSSSQRNRWTYVFGTETLTWTGAPETVVSQIADLLASEFAVGGNTPLEKFALNVAGIESVDAYGSVQAMLSGVSLIEKVRISSVTGDVVRYEVEVRGGEERLRRALRFAGLLETESRLDSIDFTGTEPLPTLEFFYGADAAASSPNEF